MLVLEIVDTNVPGVHESTSISGLVEILKKTERTTLAAIDSDSKLIGIISLHDIIKHFLPSYMDMLPSLEFLGRGKALERQLLKQIVDPETHQLFLVHDLMIRNFVAVKEKDSTFKALALMIHEGYHHLPVIDENMKYIGMIDQRKIILGLLTKSP